MMLRAFASSTIVLTGLDHWTTYLCLRAPVEGWVVSEANPFADWLFRWAGLDLGLAVDTAVTLGAVFFLVTTRVFAPNLKVAFLALITLSTGYAVVNNLGAIARLGLMPWSGDA